MIDLGPLHFPNGMCIDADGNPVFLETSDPPAFAGGGRQARAARRLAGNSPDGVTLCADGGFLVAVYYPFRLLYVPAEGGRVDMVLDDPAGIHIPMPTNVTFYDEGLRSSRSAHWEGWW